MNTTPSNNLAIHPNFQLVQNGEVHSHAALEIQVAKYRATLSTLSLSSIPIIGIHCSRPNCIFENFAFLIACLQKGWSIALIPELYSAKLASTELKKIGGATLFDACSGEIKALSEPNSSHLAKPGSCILIATSGSGSARKWTCLRPGSLTLAARSSGTTIPYGPGDNWLLTLPITHVSGLSVLWRAMTLGGTVTASTPGSTLQENLEKTGTTHVSLVPTQLHRWLSLPEFRVPRLLRHCVVGGALLPKDTGNRAIRSGLPIHYVYGMTETAAMICATSRLTETQTAFNVGHPLPHVKIRIESGNIQIQCASQAIGYWTEKGFEALPPSNEWYPTHDQGHWDPDGNLVVTGRNDTTIISGGENIAPEPIESLVMTLPTVEAACVFALPDVEYGQKLCLAIEPLPDPAKLKEFLRARLPRPWVPKYLFPWPKSLPIQGKPARNQIRELALQMPPLPF